MYVARTLTTVLAATIAAMALASTAHATSGITASEELSGDPCDVQAQNCKIVAHSEPGDETELIGHVEIFGGIESTEMICHEEYTMYLGADGSGLIHDQVMTGSECIRQPCTVAGETEWPFNAEEIGPNELNMELEFCIEELDGTTPVHCELGVHVDVIDHHNFEFAAEDTNQSDHARRCTDHTSTEADHVEIESHLVAETAESDEIEFTHL